jgi:glutaredoxin
MKTVIRSFFRTVRLVLTPFMLLGEKLTTPKAIIRTADEQAILNAAAVDLALYQFSACPFCIKVRKELIRLGLNVEKRDAQHDHQHRDALHSGGGRVKVPCLLISNADGKQEWLYESNAINNWLRARYETIPA